jgi:hypothetical protein
MYLVPDVTATRQSSRGKGSKQDKEEITARSIQLLTA